MSCLYCTNDRYWICGPDPSCEETTGLAAGPCSDYTHFVDQSIARGYYHAWCLAGQCVAILAPSQPGPQWYDAGVLGDLDGGIFEIWTKTGQGNACWVKVIPK